MRAYRRVVWLRNTKYIRGIFSSSNRAFLMPSSLTRTRSESKAQQTCLLRGSIDEQQLARR
jgi:hypothetical protein